MVCTVPCGERALFFAIVPAFAAPRIVAGREEVAVIVLMRRIVVNTRSTCRQYSTFHV